jgi:SAM-dependent methyltransferase
VFAGLVRSRFHSSGRVLDLGCGRGGLVEQLEQPLNRVVGVDPDVVSLQEHRLAGEMPLTAALSDALPFLAASFDLVFASWVLEHLARPVQEFQEIGRILRPGGAFVFITPNKSHPLIGLNRLINRFAGLQTRLVERIYGREAADTFPAYYRANNVQDLERLAAVGGMTLTTVQAVHDPTYLAFKPGFLVPAAWLDERLPGSRGIHLVGVMERGEVSSQKHQGSRCSRRRIVGDGRRAVQ